MLATFQAGRRLGDAGAGFSAFADCGEEVAVRQCDAVHSDVIPLCDEDHSVRRVSPIPKRVRTRASPPHGVDTMTYEPPARTVRPCDTVSAPPRLGPPLAEKSRPD